MRVNSVMLATLTLYRTKYLLTRILFYIQVRLPLIDSSVLIDLQTNEFIRQSSECYQLIQAAISYQKNPNDYSGVLPLELRTPRDQMLGNIYVV